MDTRLRELIKDIIEWEREQEAKVKSEGKIRKNEKVKRCGTNS